VHGIPLWQYLASHSEIAAIFNRFMTEQSQLHNAAIIESYDFSNVKTLIDVGGGHGGTLAAVLAQYPTVRGVLFDLPNVVTPASKMETARFSERCEVVGGDMMHSVPPGGDVYMIKRVMMDLTDDEGVRVLGNCISVMERNGKILIIDPMLPDGTVPHRNRLVDLHMMNVTRGRCRTEEQFRELYKASGLTVTRTVATRSPNFILEGSLP
jgi:tRNA A58 N-methylase Trm61